MSPLHSALPPLSCNFLFERRAGSGVLALRVEGSGVQWSPLVSRGACRPRGGGCAAMFLGTHTPRLDEKGRLILPAKFRDELAGGVVITKGQEGCLYGFSRAEFAR